MPIGSYPIGAAPIGGSLQTTSSTPTQTITLNSGFGISANLTTKTIDSITSNISSKSAFVLKEQTQTSTITTDITTSPTGINFSEKTLNNITETITTTKPTFNFSEKTLNNINSIIYTKSSFILQEKSLNNISEKFNFLSTAFNFSEKTQTSTVSFNTKLNPTAFNITEKSSNNITENILAKMYYSLTEKSISSISQKSNYGLYFSGNISNVAGLNAQMDWNVNSNFENTLSTTSKASSNFETFTNYSGNVSNTIGIGISTVFSLSRTNFLLDTKTSSTLSSQTKALIKPSLSIKENTNLSLFIKIKPIYIGLDLVTVNYINSKVSLEPIIYKLYTNQLNTTKFDVYTQIAAYIKSINYTVTKTNINPNISFSATSKMVSNITNKSNINTNFTNNIKEKNSLNLVIENDIKPAIRLLETNTIQSSIIAKTYLDLLIENATTFNAVALSFSLPINLSVDFTEYYITWTNGYGPPTNTTDMEIGSIYSDLSSNVIPFYTFNGTTWLPIKLEIISVIENVSNLVVGNAYQWTGPGNLMLLISIMFSNLTSSIFEISPDGLNWLIIDSTSIANVTKTFSVFIPNSWYYRFSPASFGITVEITNAVNI